MKNLLTPVAVAETATGVAPLLWPAVVIHAALTLLLARLPETGSSTQSLKQHS